MNKENAFNHMMYVFSVSWTWERLTLEERESFKAAAEAARHIIRGTYSQRCEILNEIYRAFLFGVGYTGVNWRGEGVSA